MGLYQNRNGLFDMCDNGYVRLSGCPGFDCRPIIYVDKHATGTGDGSSWENAYVDIQTAVNAHPKKEIQIKGYGESDCYPAGISLPECAYLHGMDTGGGEIWIDGGGTAEFGISGYIEIERYVENTKINNINIKDCYNGVRYLKNTEISDCTFIGIELPPGYGYGGQGIGIIFSGTISNCQAERFSQCFGGMSSVNLSNCIANKFNWGFSYISSSNFSNCIANRHAESAYPGSAGFRNCSSSIFISCISNNHTTGGSIQGYGFTACSGTFEDCTANGNYVGGFVAGLLTGIADSIFIRCTVNGTVHSNGFWNNGSSTFIDCIANDNYYCGFYSNPGSTFIGCTATGNCIGWGGDCTGHNCEV
ncbi:MAG: hypothetical protein PHH77_07745 [Victivallaceae bacterium]|nr:hypothetical protein [Victivallaceae bacterium]